MGLGVLCPRAARADDFLTLTAQGDMYADPRTVFSVSASAAKRDYSDPAHPDITAGSLSVVGGLSAAGFYVYTNAKELSTWQIKQYWHARCTSAEFWYLLPDSTQWYQAVTIFECTQYGVRGQVGFRVATTASGGQIPDVTLKEITPEHPLDSGELDITWFSR